MYRPLQLALWFALIATASSGCGGPPIEPDQHTQDVLRAHAIERLRPPRGTFRLGCDWYYHTEYPEVACQAILLVTQGSPSPTEVDWLVHARAQTATADLSVFGSWDGRNVIFSDIFLGVADPAGGFRAFGFQCANLDVQVRLEPHAETYISRAERAKAGCHLVLYPDRFPFIPE